STHRSTRRFSPRCCARTASSTSSRTASSGATSSGSGCSPRSSPPTSRSSRRPSTTSSSASPVDGCTSEGEAEAVSAAPSTITVPDGLVAVVKRECPTCTLVAPVLRDLAQRGNLHVYSQDDPTFPEGLAAADDTSLELSFALEID